MKSKKSVIIIAVILAVLAVGVSVLLLTYDKKEEKPPVTIINPSVVDDEAPKYTTAIKQVEAVEFTNIKITLVEDRKSELTATVRNTSEEHLEPMNVEIRLLNENGEVEDIFGEIVPELMPGESTTFTAYALKDITGAYDVEFAKIEE